LDSEINSSKKSVLNFNNQITNLKHTSEEHKKNNLQLKKQIDLLELQAKSMETEQANKKDALDNIKTQKEYKSLEQEISHLRRKKMDVENQITDLWYKHELLQNNVAQDEIKSAQKLDQLTRDIEIREEEIRQNSAKKDDLEVFRKKATLSIPTEWLTKYERMRNSVDDPIVPIVNDCCSACFYSILRQDISKIKQSGVLPCRNCYRFLYFDDKGEQNLNNAKY
jgi:predicted  nucleic acid-binding Zn-ribbon protein